SPCASLAYLRTEYRKRKAQKRVARAKSERERTSSFAVGDGFSFLCFSLSVLANLFALREPRLPQNRIPKAKSTKTSSQSEKRKRADVVFRCRGWLFVSVLLAISSR